MCILYENDVKSLLKFVNYININVKCNEATFENPIRFKGELNTLINELVLERSIDRGN